VTRPCWTPLGPACVLPEPAGTVLSGRFNAVAVEPRDSTGNTAYVGAAGGGIFKTTNGGVTWNPLGVDLPLSADFRFALDRRLIDLPISSISLERVGNRTILCAGTGDLFGQLGAPGSGVLVSPDGGDTWEGRPVLDPNSPDPLVKERAGPTKALHESRILAVQTIGSLPLGDGGHEVGAAGDSGLWISVGRGRSGWDRIELGNFTALADSNGRLVAARRADPNGDNEGVYRLTDDLRLTRLSGGLPPARTHTNVAIASAPSDSRMLYAAFTDGGGKINAFFRSSDGGDSWTRRVLHGEVSSGGFSDQRRIFIAVHPTDPNRVYLSDGARLLHTFDGGQTDAGWDSIHGLFVRGIAFGPASPFPAWIVTDSGVQYAPAEGTRTPPPPPTTEEEESDSGTISNTFVRPEQTVDWQDRSRGLPALQIHSIATHPTERSVVVAASPANGVLVYRSHPLWKRERGIETHTVAIDPNEPTTWYATTPFQLNRISSGVLQSKNSGKNWTTIWKGLGTADRTTGTRGGFLIEEPCPLAIDPKRKGFVYFGTDTLYRRDDTKSDPAWVPIAMPTNAGLSALAVAPSDSSIVYAADKAGRFFFVDMSGSTPAVTQRSNVQAGVSSPPAGVSSLAVSASDPQVLFASLGSPPLAVRLTNRQGFTESLFVSDDGGQSWAPIDLQLDADTTIRWGVSTVPFDVEVRKVLLHPDDGRLFLGTDWGVLVHTPDGTSLVRRFADFTANLPRVPVSDLTLLPAAPLAGEGDTPRRVLRAATFGRGVWERVLDVPDGACDGTDAFLRDTLLDTGEMPSGAPRPDPLDPKKELVSAVDLKIDRANRSGKFQKPKSNRTYLPEDDPTAVADFIGFERLKRDEPQAGRPAHVYLQIHNRGPSTAQVRARVLYTRESEVFPPLPADVFGTLFPTDRWLAVGDSQTIDVRPGEPGVVRWTTLELPRDFGPRIRFAGIAVVGPPGLALPFLPAPDDPRVITTSMNVEPAPTERGWFRWWMIPVAIGGAVAVAATIDALDIEGFDPGLI
jgi:hypothetical protein